MHRHRWSPLEKKVARAAFESAWARECGAIRRRAEAMLTASSEPEAIWRVFDYLAEKRRELAQKYDYRYSVLSNVFGRLLAEGWLTEAEIAPLQPEKIEQIKRSASAWREE